MKKFLGRRSASEHNAEQSACTGRSGRVLFVFQEATGPAPVRSGVRRDIKSHSILPGWAGFLTQLCVSPEVFQGSVDRAGCGWVATTGRGVEPFWQDSSADLNPSYIECRAWKRCVLGGAQPKRPPAILVMAPSPPAGCRHPASRFGPWRELPVLGVAGSPASAYEIILIPNRRPPMTSTMYLGRTLVVPW